MKQSIAIAYYTRLEIQKAILNFCHDREIAIRFNTFYGKRPMVIEYLSDIKNVLKNKPTSFHCSEERWVNPMLLEDKKLSNEQRNDNRLGWDLILDLDGVDFVYAQIAGKIIIDFLSDLGIYNVTTKFSGNKGFHIGIPFEAFSKNILGIGETRKLFPEIPRKIAVFLMEELKGKISKAILDHTGSIEDIAKKYGIMYSDLKIDDEKSNNLNYLKLIEIDTILIASRHLFRMPYSLNEKSGLVSIPIENSRILEFKKEEAEPEKVDPDKFREFEFLRYNPDYGKDADILLIKAYEEVSEDDVDKINKIVSKEKRGEKMGIIFEGDESQEVFEINSEVKREDFPKTIDYLLNAKLEDGRKRAMFVLLTFLYSIKFNSDVIERIIVEWNEKQEQALRDNIVRGQLNWFKNQSKIISPPNFSNQEYYKSIGVPEIVLLEDINKFKPIRIKNPLHYIFILLKKRKVKEENNKKEIGKKKG